MSNSGLLAGARDLVSRLSGGIAALPEVPRRFRARAELPVLARADYALAPVRQACGWKRDWISWRTCGNGGVRQSGEDRQPSFADRWYQFLHRLHSFQSSVILAAGLAILLPACSFAIAGFAGAHQDDGSVAAGHARTLMAVAGILGAVAGILFAVVVFGIQFHGERLGRTAFLVRYLGRREGFVPLAGFVLGIIGANVVVSLISELLLPTAATVHVVLNLAFAPLVLGVTLWLFHRMVASVSGDFLRDSVLPGIGWEYEVALDREIYLSNLRHEATKHLNRLDVEYSSWYGAFATRHDRWDLDLRAHRHGEIIDFNIAALEHACGLVADHLPGFQLVLTALPGDPVGDTSMLWLKDQAGNSPRNISPELHRRLKTCVRSMVRLRRSESHELADVLSRLTEVLTDQAAYDRPDQLTRGLDVLEELLRVRVTRRGAEQLESVGLHPIPDYFRESAYFKMARAAVESGDFNKIETVLRFAARVMTIAKQTGRIDLFARGGDLISLVYREAMREGVSPEQTARSVDMWIHSVTLSLIVGERDEDSERSEPAGAHSALLKASISWILWLMRSAVEGNRRQDVEDFLDRLQQFAHASHLWRATPQAAANRRQSVGYAEIVIVGWCVRMLRQGEEHSEAAAAVVERLVRKHTRQSDLVQLWEAIISPTQGGRLISVDQWASAERRWRSGIAYSARQEGWILPGFVALLLGSYKLPYRRRASSDPCPPAEPPSDDQIHRIMAELLDAEPVRAALAVSTDVTEKAKESVRTLFSERRRRWKVEGVRHVVKAPLSVSRINGATAGVAEALEERRFRWIHRLREQDVARATGAVAGFLPSIEVRWRQFRHSYIEDASAFLSGGSECLAESISRDEAGRLLWGLERLDVVREHAPLAALHLLRQATQAVVSELRAEGYAPSDIWLPRQPRFAKALFGSPDWQAPGRRQEEAHIGVWDGIDVHQFPYTDPDSVLVVDSAATFGRLTEKALDLKLWIEDAPRSELNELLERAERATVESDVPDALEAYVHLCGRFVPCLGLRDGQAFRRIPLDLATIGYAQPSGDSYFHRPTCERLADQTAKFSLTLLPDARDERREPCPVCRPEEWDDPDTFEQLE